MAAFGVDVLAPGQFEKGLELGQRNVTELPGGHGLQSKSNFAWEGFDPDAVRDLPVVLVIRQ